uniref:Translation initiation factor IF-2 n=1 Tax=Panagrellus redivivus TaxID=6233 RepID=A0A7E4VWS3_PANRE
MVLSRGLIASAVVVLAVLEFGDGQLEQVGFAVGGILDSVLHPRPPPPMGGFGMGPEGPPRHRHRPRFDDYEEGGPEWGPQGGGRGPWGGGPRGGGPWGGRGGGRWGGGPRGGGPWGAGGEGGDWNGPQDGPNGAGWGGPQGPQGPNGWNGPTGSGGAAGNAAWSSQQPQQPVPATRTPAASVPPSQSFADIDTTGARTFANNANPAPAPAPAATRAPAPAPTRAPAPAPPPRATPAPARATAAPIRQPGTSGGGLFGDPNNRPATLRGPPASR